MTLKKSLSNRVNKICSVLLVAWVCWPWLGQNTGLLGGFFLAFMWCITAFFMSDKHTFGYEGMLMGFYAIYMMLSFIVTRRVYANYQLYYFISMVTLFFLPYYMMRFYFKREETKFLGKLAVFAIVCMIVGCLTSIYYTSIDENIMKTISQSLDTEFVEYRKVGIGSFGFVYMVMFSVLSVIGAFKAKLASQNIRVKILLIVFCVIGIKCLIDSTFTTALLLTICGILFVIVMSKKSKASNISVGLISVLVFLVAARFLGRFLSTVSLASEDVTVRLREIGNLLMGEEGGENTTSRMEYLQRAFRCFFESPILGYNFASSPRYLPGGHSEWIDIFGIYGLIGGIPIVISLIIKLKNTLIISKTNNYPYYGVIIFIFVFYGFLDPFLTLYHIGFGMFFIIPCIGCISQAFKKEAVKSEDTLDN